MAFKKSLPLLVIAGLLFVFFYFQLYRYLTLECLRNNRYWLLHWTDENYLLAVLLYLGCYSLAVSAAFPGAFVFSLAGGFLFGTFPGALYVVFSATLGSIGLFCSIRLALADWFEQRAGHRIQVLEAGFRKQAFLYLLILRFIPIFPFVLVNIAAGLFNIPLRTFIGATFLGLIPGTIIYTTIGKNLNSLFDLHQELGISLLFQPTFIVPLVCLGILALIPLIYRQFRK